MDTWIGQHTTKYQQRHQGYRQKFRLTDVDSFMSQLFLPALDCSASASDVSEGVILTAESGNQKFVVCSREPVSDHRDCSSLVTFGSYPENCLDRSDETAS